MQTFLPYPDFRRCAEALDNKRLGNQCYRECKTLLNGGWSNHPASKMWRGHEYWLCEYAKAMAFEIAKRNYWKPDIGPKWHFYFDEKKHLYAPSDRPRWLGNERLHLSHQRALYMKDPEHYSQFQFAPDVPLYWPANA